MDLENGKLSTNSTSIYDLIQTDDKFLYTNPFEQKLQIQPHWTAWLGIPFVLGTIIISWTFYIFIFIIIHRVRSMRHICYFYIVSLNVTMMLHSLTNFPLSFIMELMGEIPYTNIICAISVAMETITCHSILLHLMGSSLDTYFRLAKPRWFSLSNPRPATIRLKLAAPWIVSILQTVAQIILGDPFPPSQLEDERLCTSPDINFLILRTFVAFSLPLLTSIVILFMAAHRLQKLQRIQPRKPESDIKYECHLTQCMRKCNCLRSRKPEASSEEIVVMPLAYENIFPEQTETCLNILTSSSPKMQTVQHVPPPMDSPIHFKPNKSSLPGKIKSDLILDTIQYQVLAVTNTQHGSTSSDTGVSSQTTDEISEEHQRRNPTFIDANNASSLTHWDILPQVVTSTQMVLPTSPSHNQLNSPVYFEILNHYCPQHGQVFIPVKPETLYKPVLAVLEEKDYQYNPTVSLTDSESVKISNLTSVNPLSATQNLTNTNLSLGYTKENYGAFQQQQELEQEQPIKTSSLSNHHHDFIKWSHSSKRFSEQRAVKLNMITCAITIAMWAPFIAASLSHLLLSNSRYYHLLSIRTLIQFKWLTYFSCIVYPLGFICIDHELFRQFKWICRKKCGSRTDKDLSHVTTVTPTTSV